MFWLLPSYHTCIAQESDWRTLKTRFLLPSFGEKETEENLFKHMWTLFLLAIINIQIDSVLNDNFLTHSYKPNDKNYSQNRSYVVGDISAVVS